MHNSVDRCRVRELGLTPGILPPGPLNDITDVAGVRVGHLTLIEGDDIRTGATAILPHSGNLFREKVPAGLAVGNGYGKLMGATQLVELGEIETPILLTNTLAVPRAAEATLDWTLAQVGNENVHSVNPIVGETNDGTLNNIRKRALTVQHMRMAIEAAREGAVAEGNVGAGTGMICFNWKGGVGTSSRQLPTSLGGYVVGALVQTNYGGILQMDGIPVGKELGEYYLKDELTRQSADGSIMIVIATDAPLSDRNLSRLAWRGLSGLARTGSAMSNGSGDYAIAFSTAEAVRRKPVGHVLNVTILEIPNEGVSPLFLAAIEATEEAIYNSLCMAKTMEGYRGSKIEAIPLEKVRSLIQER